MTLRLYTNHHVRSEIVDGLRTHGIDVLTALEDGAAAQEDERLMDRATAAGQILFSQDHDMLRIAAMRQQSGVAFSGLIYAHQLRITIGQAIEQLELLCGVYDPQEMMNQIEHLPLR